MQKAPQDWCASVIAMGKALAQLVEEHFPDGFSWNPAGVACSEYTAKPVEPVESVEPANPMAGLKAELAQLAQKRNADGSLQLRHVEKSGNTYTRTYSSPSSPKGNSTAVVTDPLIASNAHSSSTWMIVYTLILRSDSYMEVSTQTHHRLIALVEQRAVDEDQLRALEESLVDEHVEAHEQQQSVRQSIHHRHETPTPPTSSPTPR